MSLRRLAKAALNSVGLLAVLRTARVLGWRHALQEARYAVVGAPDGFPVPPAHVRGLIVGRGVATVHATVHEYLSIGRGCAEAVIEVLAAHATKLTDTQPILDFGCGCGRVMQVLYAPHRRLTIYGTDINAKQVAWSRANLPFTGLGVNRPEPPLDFGDGMFGLVYAFSVFTHLVETLQLP
jgi:SAM-dependent methyltransferase